MTDPAHPSRVGGEPRPANSTRPLRLSPARVARGLAVAGVVAIAIYYRSAVVAALAHAWRMGWAFLWLLPLFWIWNLAATSGWRALLSAAGRSEGPGLHRLALLRLKGQSVNLVLPFSVGAPLVKAALLAREKVGLGQGGASVVFDTITSAVAGLLFALFAVSVGMAARPAALSGGWLAWTTLAGAALGLVALLAMAPRLAYTLARAGRLNRASSFGQVVAHLASSGPRLHRSVATSIGWHLVERALMAVEVIFIAWVLGARLDVAGALFAAGLMSGFTLVFFFLPGQVGAAEGGLAFAFAALGLSPALGLGVALVRRARQIVVFGLGLAWLLLVDGLTPNASRTSLGREGLGKPRCSSASPEPLAARIGTDTATAPASGGAPTAWLPDAEEKAAEGPDPLAVLEEPTGVAFPRA